MGLESAAKVQRVARAYTVRARAPDATSPTYTHTVYMVAQATSFRGAPPLLDGTKFPADGAKLTR